MFRDDVRVAHNGNLFYRLERIICDLGCPIANAVIYSDRSFLFLFFRAGVNLLRGGPPRNRGPPVTTIGAVVSPSRAGSSEPDR